MRLSKHHGAGNDFLVLLDVDGTVPVTGDAARTVCDRRRGVGADGLVHLGPDRVMALWNADGSRAETSGNGLRCLGQALARSEGTDTFDVIVTTAAGPRRLEIRPGPDARTAWVRAEMGPVRIEAVSGGEAWVDVGNPHLVLRLGSIGAVEDADLTALGAANPGVNVEIIAAGPEPDALTLRVHERGAGLTEACGSGSCAASVAAHHWGLVGTVVMVHNPGGDVTVEAKPEMVTLAGPIVHVADVEVDLWP